MLLICQDGHAVSMASFLDINVRDGEEWKPAKYVYAVATLPEYRGRGYAGKILKKAEEIFNMPLVLVPAEKELVGYYRKDWVQQRRIHRSVYWKNRMCRNFLQRN